jgi:hypothetical protein
MLLLRRERRVNTTRGKDAYVGPSSNEKRRTKKGTKYNTNATRPLTTSSWREKKGDESEALGTKRRVTIVKPT